VGRGGLGLRRRGLGLGKVEDVLVYGERKEEEVSQAWDKSSCE